MNIIEAGIVEPPDIETAAHLHSQSTISVTTIFPPLSPCPLGHNLRKLLRLFSTTSPTWPSPQPTLYPSGLSLLITTPFRPPSLPPSHTQLLPIAPQSPTLAPIPCHSHRAVRPAIFLYRCDPPRPSWCHIWQSVRGRWLSSSLCIRRCLVPFGSFGDTRGLSGSCWVGFFTCRRVDHVCKRSVQPHQQLLAPPPK